jgi:hypothetical protein
MWCEREPPPAIPQNAIVLNENESRHNNSQFKSRYLSSRVSQKQQHHLIESLLQPPGVVPGFTVEGHHVVHF